MSTVAKLVTGALLGLGTVAGLTYVKHLKQASQELQVIPKVSVYNLSWTGLTLRVDVLLKNPTKGSFSIKFPFVKLLYKDTLIGSSAPIDTDIKIPAFGQAAIEKILVQIPMSSVFSVVFNLIKALNNNEAATITVTSFTTINLGWITLPYENKADVTIKK